MVIDLGPSWPPYHGYKKIGFEDLSLFHSKYKFGIGSILAEKLFRKNRSNWSERNQTSRLKKGLTLHVSQKVDDSVISQVNSLSSTSRIRSVLTFDILKWRTIRSGKQYVYAYATEDSGKLQGFVMFRTADYFHYDLGLFLSYEFDVFLQLFRFFKKEFKPATVAAWDFALDETSRQLLKKLSMVSIPFINKIRKSPPALVRTLQTNEDGSLNWTIGGVDIRKVENWTINKFDLDSF